jgi:hypothetical protein
MKNMKLDEDITELSNTIESEISSSMISNIFEIA